MGHDIPVPQKRKGLSNLAWIGIGCAVFLVLCLVVAGVGLWWVASKAKDAVAEFEANPELTTARVIIKASPELEEVSADEDAGTITVRNTKTGEVVTVNLSDVGKGKISFSKGDQEVSIEATGEGERGEVSIRSKDGDLHFSTGDRAPSERPDWVVLYPDCEAESQYSQTLANGVSGAVRCTSDAAIEKVVEFYRASLERAGFVVRVNTISGDGGQVAMLDARNQDQGRTIMVNTTSENGTCVIALTYNEKRD